jgi:hypothetical protein
MVPDGRFEQRGSLEGQRLEGVLGRDGGRRQAAAEASSPSSRTKNPYRPKKCLASPTLKCAVMRPPAAAAVRRREPLKDMPSATELEWTL